jgi:hypothetical protein
MSEPLEGNTFLSICSAWWGPVLGRDIRKEMDSWELQDPSNPESLAVPYSLEDPEVLCPNK